MDTIADFKVSIKVSRVILRDFVLWFTYFCKVLSRHNLIKSFYAILTLAQSAWKLVFYRWDIFDSRFLPSSSKYLILLHKAIIIEIFSQLAWIVFNLFRLRIGKRNFESNLYIRMQNFVSFEEDFQTYTQTVLFNLFAVPLVDCTSKAHVPLRWYFDHINAVCISFSKMLIELVSRKRAQFYALLQQICSLSCIHHD